MKLKLVPGPEYRITKEYGQRYTEHRLPPIHFQGIPPKERLEALQNLADYFRADRFAIGSSELGRIDLNASYTLFPSSERCKLRERIVDKGFIFLFTYAAMMKETEQQSLIHNSLRETKRKNSNKDNFVKSLDQMLENISQQYQQRFDGAYVLGITYISKNYRVIVTPDDVQYVFENIFQSLDVKFFERIGR